MLQHDLLDRGLHFHLSAAQLHMHVVIFNMTQVEDGKVRFVQPGELYDSQKLRDRDLPRPLAEELQALGYEIRVDPRTGAPEIKGFSPTYSDSGFVSFGKALARGFSLSPKEPKVSLLSTSASNPSKQPNRARG